MASRGNRYYSIGRETPGGPLAFLGWSRTPGAAQARKGTQYIIWARDRQQAARLLRRDYGVTMPAAPAAPELPELVLRTFRRDGTEVFPGDEVTDFRGEPRVFKHATRAPDGGRTGKIVTDWGEVYMTVCNLRVRGDLPADGKVTRVIFRAWDDPASPDGDCVIALFPDEPWSKQPGMVASYEHVGQHGAADLAGVLKVTRPADRSEYAALRRELMSAPFDYLLIEDLTDYEAAAV